MLKSGKAENLLAVITKYEILKFCKIWSQLDGILPNQYLGYLDRCPSVLSLLISDRCKT